MGNREKQITDYLDNVESQHRTKERFIETLSMILTKIDHGTETAEEIPIDFYVQNAIGAQLDVLGEIIGADRRFPPVTIPGYPEMLNDDLFRYVLLAKIIQNSWDGTNESFRDIWDATMSDKIDASYYDNQDMSMDVRVTSPIEPLMVELLLHGYIIPKPLGVRMNINAILDAEECLAYADGVATLDDAEISCPINYFPERNAEAALIYAPVGCASTGRVLCDLEYNINGEALANIISAAAISANSSRAMCCMKYCEYSCIEERGYSGAGGIVSGARVIIKVK